MGALCGMPEAAAMHQADVLETGQDVQRAARAGFSGLTVGRAKGSVQANLVVLPEAHAADFSDYCRANAAACPLLAIGALGATVLPELGNEIDVRTDLPAYLIHEGGRQQRASSLAHIFCQGSILASGPSISRLPPPSALLRQ